MTPDPFTISFLEGMRAAGGKPLYEQTIDEAREVVKMASLQLAPPAADVYHRVDRKVAVHGGEIGVRIYMPRPVADRELLPIVIYYHGGGFVVGDLDTHDAIARYYCKHADAVVINVDYRLAPEHRFPTAVDDAYAALTWAVEQAQELQGDPQRIAVAGDSAGGNLAAVVCQLARERRGPHIAFQALVYPTVDFDLTASYPSRAQFGGGDYFLSNRDMEWFRSQYLADADQVDDPRVSPLRQADVSGLPPALIVTAGCDMLCDEGKAYAGRLAAAGVPVEHRCFEQAIHAFMSFAGAIPTGLEALSFVAVRLRAAVHSA
jgi:acetyl esterase